MSLLSFVLDSSRQTMREPYYQSVERIQSVPTTIQPMNRPHAHFILSSSRFAGYKYIGPLPRKNVLTIKRVAISPAKRPNCCPQVMQKIHHELASPRTSHRFAAGASETESHSLPSP